MVFGTRILKTKKSWDQDWSWLGLPNPFKGTLELTLKEPCLTAQSIQKQGPKDHTNMRISHSGSLRPNRRGIPEILFCRILMFMWSCSALKTRSELVRARTPARELLAQSLSLRSQLPATEPWLAALWETGLLLRNLI